MSSNPLDNSVLCSMDNGNIILVHTPPLLCPLIKSSNEKEMVYLADNVQVMDHHGRNSKQKLKPNVEAESVEGCCLLSRSLAHA